MKVSTKSGGDYKPSEFIHSNILLQSLCSCTWLDLIRTDPEFLHVKNKSMSSQNHHKIHALCFRVSWKVIKMWVWGGGP